MCTTESMNEKIRLLKQPVPGMELRTSNDRLVVTDVHSPVPDTIEVVYHLNGSGPYKRWLARWNELIPATIENFGDDLTITAPPTH